MNQSAGISVPTEADVTKYDWEEVLLDSVAKRGSGHTPDKKHPEYWGGPIKWISLQDSAQLDALYIEETAATITVEGIKNSSAVLHQKGTVVLSRDAGVGKSAIMATDMAVSQHFMAWTCGQRLDNHFLYYWLQSKKPEFERIANGNTIKTIGLPYFKDLTIPLPPPEEQKRIASAMSGIDELISSLNQLIVKKRDIHQAAMQQLLTGQRRLPGFNGEWKVKRLGDLVSRMANGCVYTSDEKNGLPITRIETISDGTINWERIGYAKPSPEVELYKIQCGDILYSHINSIDHIGKVARFSDCKPLYHGMNLILLRPTSGVDSDFLFRLIGSEKIRRTARLLAKQAVSQASINTKELRALELTIPVLGEQTAIATILSDMDAELTAIEARREKARQLKQGMMQELLTGRIRLA